MKKPMLEELILHLNARNRTRNITTCPPVNISEEIDKFLTRWLHRGLKPYPLEHPVYGKLMVLARDDKNGARKLNNLVKSLRNAKQ